MLNIWPKSIFSQQVTHLTQISYNLKSNKLDDLKKYIHKQFTLYLLKPCQKLSQIFYLGLLHVVKYIWWQQSTFLEPYQPWNGLASREPSLSTLYSRIWLPNRSIYSGTPQKSDKSLINLQSITSAIQTLSLCRTTFIT